MLTDEQTDRELLELAAKAAGEITEEWAGNDAYLSGVLDRWHPLTDDGDALRLAVKLNLRVMPQEKCVYVESNPDSMLGFPSVSELEMNGDDPYAAARRAIVRAAAAAAAAIEIRALQDQAPQPTTGNVLRDAYEEMVEHWDQVPQPPEQMAERKQLSVDALAQEIRRVDGNHCLGAAALAEALMPFLASITQQGADDEK